MEIDLPKLKQSYTALPRIVMEIQSRNLVDDESKDLEGEGWKVIKPSNNSDFYTRLEVLLELKLSGKTDTPTDASFLIDDLYRIGETQNEETMKKALDNFHTF